MLRNDCEFVRDKLSAFYDGELGANEAEVTDSHLQNCASCREELSSFQSISAVFAETSSGGSPGRWPDLASELTAQGGAASTARHLPVRTPGLPQLVGGLVLAASLLVAIGLWFYLESDRPGSVASKQGSATGHQHGAMAMSDEHMKQFVGVMDQYLSALPNDPDAAERFLSAKFQGSNVSPDEAATLVGYRPMIAGGLPDGYSLASSSVLKMPCCTCFKAVCRRRDGSTLVLFEHDDEETEWFGDRPSSIETCGEKDCCLVQLDSSIAATWKEGSRSVTAVGVKDQEEVTKLVSWLGERGVASGE